MSEDAVNRRQSAARATFTGDLELARKALANLAVLY